MRVIFPVYLGSAAFATLTAPSPLIRAAPLSALLLFIAKVSLTANFYFFWRCSKRAAREQMSPSFSVQPVRFT